MKAETLKKSILQYAMQGKLVEQNPDDEPASELLKRIKAEKEQLIKDGKIKKEKPLPSIADEEIPYKLPKGWEWVRLDDLSTINGGYAFKSQNYTNSGVRVIRISDFDETGFKQDKIVHYEENEKYDNFIIDNSDILLAMTGGTVGKSYYVCTSGQKMYVNQRVADIKINKMVSSKYINFLILSPLTQDKISACKNSTNDNISMLDIRSFYVPLPPLAEQQRIVEKLEQILPLIEEYGKNEEKLSELNKTLPDKIKQSILQHAVQGKLVPQNPTDETASELLKRIKSEKEQLIKDGKIKKEKPLSPITEDEILYELPQGWRWVRLGDVGMSKIGLTYKPTDITTTHKGIPVLRSSNIQNSKINLNDLVRVTTEINNENLFVQKGDILICARNGSKNLVGKAAIIEKLDEPMTFGAFMAIFRSSINDWVKIYLASPLFKKTLESVNTVTINQITQNNLKNALIPLPPLAEQQRIVDKVEELMKIIDKIKEIE